MNYLFFTDLHIRENELAECKDVLSEIADLKVKYKVDRIFDCGDTFDKINPSSLEIDIFANFVKQVDIPITVIVANSHESTSPEESILNHFSILKENVQTVKEYIDEKHLFCGHFIAKESKKNYGGTVAKTTLKEYKYVVLGHGHSFEVIAPNICQLGASRYIDFAESQDEAKAVLLIENYGEDNEKFHFLRLNSVISMKDVYVDITGQKVPDKAFLATNSEMLINILNKIDAKTKVRVIFKDFDSYKYFIPQYQTYKEKFMLFKDRKDFITTTNTNVAKAKQISLKDSLTKFLEVNKVDNEIKQILLKEIA